MQIFRWRLNGGTSFEALSFITLNREIHEAEKNTVLSFFDDDWTRTPNAFVRIDMQMDQMADIILIAFELNFFLDSIVCSEPQKNDKRKMCSRPVNLCDGWLSSPHSHRSSHFDLHKLINYSITLIYAWRSTDSPFSLNARSKWLFGEEKSDSLEESEEKGRSRRAREAKNRRTEVKVSACVQRWNIFYFIFIIVNSLHCDLN